MKFLKINYCLLELGTFSNLRQIKLLNYFWVPMAQWYDDLNAIHDGRFWQGKKYSIFVYTCSTGFAHS